MLDIQVADRSLVRDVNILAVLEVLRGPEPITRAEIARATGLSAPTVSAVVGRLLAGGIVVEEGRGPATGGRRGGLVHLCADARTTLGLDLGSSPPMAGLLDLRGQIVDGSLRPIPAGSLADADSLAAWVAATVPRRGLLGVCVGVPGVTDTAQGVVQWAPALDWRNVDLQAALRARLSAPVLVDNDVNLAAVGEYASSPGRMRHMAMLALREGLGAGIILDGKLHRGAHFAAGEVGYLLSGHAALAQEAVSFGSLEAALWRLLHVDGQPRGAGGQAAVPLSGAAGRRPLPAQAAEAVADYLALACIAVAAILDVQRIVLGGHAAVLGEQVVTRVAEQLRAHVPHPPEVVLSQLGDLAAIRGAGLALQQELGPELGALLR